MKIWKLLPKLAWRGIAQNRSVYIPYIFASIVTCFTFFVFSSILKNDIISKVPHSVYAYALLQIGSMLLVLILLPFLYYANSFLIKHRKKELGLYSLLGLEKKHIGMMMFLETIFLYIIVLTVAIVSGAVLSKFVFLLLLKMSGLPITLEFTFEIQAVFGTMTVFGMLFAVNFIANLIAVGKANPVELLSGSKKGEKEPRFIAFFGILGIILMGGGYYISITAKMDSYIFTNFFLAVFLVVLGTYFLFTSGSIFFLKLIKKNKKVYYHPNRFITISGMLYRMKKNAAGLSNICIFATMVIITLTCTISMYLGMKNIESFDYPYDMVSSFQTEGLSEADMNAEVEALCQKYQVELDRLDAYDAFNTSLTKRNSHFGEDSEQEYKSFDSYFITVNEYKKLENVSLELKENEIAVFTSGPDFHFTEISLAGEQYTVKQELTAYRPFTKNQRNALIPEFVFVFRDDQVREQAITSLAQIKKLDAQKLIDQGISRRYCLLLKGEDAVKREYISEYTEWISAQPGFEALKDGLEGRFNYRVANGSLLFIGVIFGSIFFMCLLLVMYYKQISEGYEDQNSFSIMRKVGLSDEETRKTIHRQILFVFGLPLVFSFLHTFAGIFMVDILMAAIRFFNSTLIWGCTAGVAVLFTVIYITCYFFTARSYYRIVKEN